MKRYEFHSGLTPEQVFAKLDELAPDKTVFNTWKGEFTHVRKENLFSLLWVRRLVKGHTLHFKGQVIPEKDGSLITGGFGLSAGGIFVRAVVWFGLLCIFFLWRQSSLQDAAGLAAIILSVCAGVIFVNEKFFCRKYRQAELDFIKKNLLGPAEGPEHETV